MSLFFLGIFLGMLLMFGIMLIMASLSIRNKKKKLAEQIASVQQIPKIKK